MASNGGMQPTRQRLVMPTEEGGMNGDVATGDGGHKCLVNQNEAKILDSTIEYGGYRAVDNTWNGVEDDSHVQGIYREADFAGS